MGELAAFMARVQTAVGSLELLVGSAAFLLGIFGIFNGVKTLARTGGGGAPGAYSRERAIGTWSLVGGALMLAMPAFIAASGFSLFGPTNATPDPNEIFAYSGDMLAVLDNENSRVILVAALAIVQFIGVIGIVRAVSLLMKAPYHPGMGLYGRATAHLVGGTLAVNIVLFTGIIENLFLGT